LTFTKELVEKAQKGDLAAFEELVVIYQDRVFTHCCHLTGNRDDGQDLAQDVFVQAFKSIKSFRFKADFGTWLHRIAVNSWINQVRKQNKISFIFLDEPIKNLNGEAKRELAAVDEPLDMQVERQEFLSIIQSALNNLSPEYRVVLVLREIEGYSYEEIMKMLNCSLGTVKSRLNRARRALKAELENSGILRGFSI
jgi:RNA polymerase sigma-70 factor (ECF subfamily)